MYSELSCGSRLRQRRGTFDVAAVMGTCDVAPRGRLRRTFTKSRKLRRNSAPRALCCDSANRNIQRDLLRSVRSSVKEWRPFSRMVVPLAASNDPVAFRRRSLVEVGSILASDPVSMKRWFYHLRKSTGVPCH